MRTTIDFPDDLYRQVKARAALDGISLKKLVTRYVLQGLSWSAQWRAEEARPQRSELPILRAATGRPLPVCSNAEIYRILDDEDTDARQH